MDCFAMAAALVTVLNMVGTVFAQEIDSPIPLEGKRIDSVQVIFDQNDPAFYRGSTERMTEFPQTPDSKTPFNKFAVCTTMSNGRHRIQAFEPKPQDFKDLKTGYYVVPASSPASLNTFGLVANADDPRNTYHDIAYMIPCVSPWDPKKRKDELLRPWSKGFDSLEYSVDMRVPFARSQNVDHPTLIDDNPDSGDRSDFAVPYVVGGLLLRQVRSMAKNKSPAFWISVSLFDPRKHYVRESITMDAWSGGTNYPIVMTAIGDKASPDDGDAPPDAQVTQSKRVYSFTLPESESLLTESDPDDRFHHIAFRISGENLLAAIDKIRERMPQLYGDNGSMEMSTNLSDWALAQFNFGAEIFHRSTFEGPIDPEDSRAMVVEFKDLHIQRALRSRQHCAFESLVSEVAAKRATCETILAVP